MDFGDLVIAETGHLAQDLVGVLAEQRRAGDLARGVRQLDRVADRDVLAAGRMIDLGRDADRAQRLVVVRIRARYPRLQVSVRRSALIEEDPDEFDIGISMRLVDGPRKAPDDGRILIARESVLSRTAYLRPPPLILSLSQSSAIRAGPAGWDTPRKAWSIPRMPSSSTAC